MTNEFIALVKNTTLVLVVSILDLLGIAQASLADPAWVGMNMEAYVFSGAIYWFALLRPLALEPLAREAAAGRSRPVRGFQWQVRQLRGRRYPAGRRVSGNTLEVVG